MAPQAADAIDVDKGTVDVEYVEGPPMAWGGRDTGGTIAVITLNRAKSLNSLTYGMIASLASAFRTLRQDGTVCCCVLTGTGRAFCSGVDLTAAAQVFRGDNEADRTNDAVAEMELCPFPIIGAVNGACVTAGFELALGKFDDDDDACGVDRFPNGGARPGPACCTTSMRPPIIIVLRASTFPPCSI